MNKTGKHIVVLTPGFAADENDSTCIPVMQHFIKTYIRQYPDDTISIISFQYPFVNKKYRWHGVDIYSMGGNNSRFPFRFITWMRVLACFKKINTKQHIDLIQAYWLTECAYIGQVLSKKYKIKCIATANGQDCLPKNRYLNYLRLKKLHIIVLSDFLNKKLYEASGRWADEIIPFGESQPFLSYDLSQARNIDILAVGSIVKVKNYELFIDIISELEQEFPNLNCVILGNQPDENELKKIQNLIKKDELGENIMLAGQIDHPDVLKYMIRSKILLHTSEFEGQAMVFSEALGSGMTVVCFNVGHTYPRKMIICKTRSDMVENLKVLIRRKDLDFHPVYFEKMIDQVERYHQIYHS